MRRADRRAGANVLLRQVATDLLNAPDRRHLALLLTQRLAQLTNVRSVGLKEISRSMPPKAV